MKVRIKPDVILIFRTFRSNSISYFCESPNNVMVYLCRIHSALPMITLPELLFQDHLSITNAAILDAVDTKDEQTREELDE